MKYCLVTQELSKVIPDEFGSADEVTGSVRFTPVLPYGGSFQVDTSKGLVTVPGSSVSADISHGSLSFEGKPGVMLFAGGENSNPNEVYWKVEYVGLKIRGRDVQLSGFTFLAEPDGELDLTLVTPVVGVAPEGTSRGPRGLPGETGLTPHIEGDTWWIGDVNTSIPVTGPKGDTGDTPSRTTRLLIHHGTDTPTLSLFPDIQVGDIIERASDGARWRIDE